MVWCQWFGVYIGFSDGDRIFTQQLYIFKGYEAKKLIKEFPSKV